MAKEATSERQFALLLVCLFEVKTSIFLEVSSGNAPTIKRWDSVLNGRTTDVAVQTLRRRNLRHSGHSFLEACITAQH